MTSIIKDFFSTSLTRATLEFERINKETKYKLLALPSLSQLHGNISLTSLLITSLNKYCFGIATRVIELKNLPPVVKLTIKGKLEKDEKLFGKLILTQYKNRQLPLIDLQACAHIGMHLKKNLVDFPDHLDLTCHLEHLMLQEIAKVKQVAQSYFFFENEALSNEGFSYLVWKHRSGSFLIQWSLVGFLKKGEVVFQPLNQSHSRGVFFDKHQQLVNDAVGFSFNFRCNTLDPSTYQIYLNCMNGAPFNLKVWQKTHKSFSIDFFASCVWRPFDFIYNSSNCFEIRGRLNVLDENDQTSIEFLPPPISDYETEDMKQDYLFFYEAGKPYVISKVLSLKQEIIRCLGNDFVKNRIQNFVELSPAHEKRDKIDRQAKLELLQEAMTNNDSTLIRYLQNMEPCEFTQEELQNAQAQIGVTEIEPALSLERLELIEEAVPCPVAADSKNDRVEEKSIPAEISPKIIARAMINHIESENRKAPTLSKEELQLKKPLKAKKKKQYLLAQEKKENSSQQVSSTLSSPSSSIEERIYIEFKKTDIRTKAHSSASIYLQGQHRKYFTALHEGIAIAQKDYVGFKKALIQARAKALGLNYRETRNGSHGTGYADRGFPLYFEHSNEHLPNAKEQWQETTEILDIRGPINSKRNLNKY